MKQEEVDKLAKKIWDYMRIDEKLEKADCILVLGTHDTRIAERGAQLFLEGWAPWIIFSGGYGKLTSSVFDKTEAEKFAEVAAGMGVPKEKILIETQSDNTGGNILLTKKMLEDKRIPHKKIIVVDKPYKTRRTSAAMRKLWPEQKFIITTSPLSFEDYFNGYPREGVSRDEAISILVGDLQRMKVYSEKGFQIAEEIPPDVRDAYGRLVDAGYKKYLV